MRPATRTVGPSSASWAMDSPSFRIDATAWELSNRLPHGSIPSPEVLPVYLDVPGEEQ